MTFKVDTLSVGSAAKFLRVSVRTLQRWDNEEKLVASRTETGRREYTRQQLIDFVSEHSRVVKSDRTTYVRKIT